MKYYSFFICCTIVGTLPFCVFAANTYYLPTLWSHLIALHNAIDNEYDLTHETNTRKIIDAMSLLNGAAKSDMRMHESACKDYSVDGLSLTQVFADFIHEMFPADSALMDYEIFSALAIDGILFHVECKHERAVQLWLWLVDNNHLSYRTLLQEGNLTTMIFSPEKLTPKIFETEKDRERFYIHFSWLLLMIHKMIADKINAAAEEECISADDAVSDCYSLKRSFIKAVKRIEKYLSPETLEEHINSVIHLTSSSLPKQARLLVYKDDLRRCFNSPLYKKGRSNTWVTKHT